MSFFGVYVDDKILIESGSKLENTLEGVDKPRILGSRMDSANRNESARPNY